MIKCRNGHEQNLENTCYINSKRNGLYVACKICRRISTDKAREKKRGGKYIEPTKEELFWAKVRKTDICWLWKGATRNNYGAFRGNNETLYAHRVAYEYLIGPIPEGLELDHICVNKHCCNPAHLEAVTHQENMQRHQDRKKDAQPKNIASKSAER